MEIKYFVATLFIAFSIVELTLVEAQTVNRGDAVAYAVRQYKRLLSNFTVGRYTAETSPLNAFWPTVGPSDMKAGYFPGLLWNLYRYTRDSYWRRVATDFIDPLAIIPTFINTENYAVSFGTAYDITGNASYTNPIIRCADSVISAKYNASFGYLMEFKGINDTRVGDTYNLVELECLVRAWNLTGNRSYKQIAITVLDNALKIFRRPNDTTYTNAVFNLTSGQIIDIYTANSPLSPWGWWSRGHMWLIVGLVDVYRVTRIKRFLAAAESFASVYIDNLPADSITFHEFYTANLPGYWVRDTASASIAAAYFPEIASYTSNSRLRQRLLSTSNSIFRSLMSAKYRADGNPAYRLPALVANATHNIPVQQDYCFSIPDYYFTKAIQYLPR